MVLAVVSFSFLFLVSFSFCATFSAVCVFWMHSSWCSWTVFICGSRNNCSTVSRLCLYFLIFWYNFFSCFAASYCGRHMYNGPFSVATRVSRYQKGKTNLDFWSKRQWVAGSGISWAVCKSAPRCRQITMPAPHHSVCYGLDAFPVSQPTALKHWLCSRIHWLNESSIRWLFHHSGQAGNLFGNPWK